jgi:hypothetical protein
MEPIQLWIQEVVKLSQGNQKPYFIWGMTAEECDKHHLSCKFNKKINETIEIF